MKKEVKRVPRGTRFLSEWKEFDLNNYPRKVIIDKGYSGCGFVHYVLATYKSPVIYLALDEIDIFNRYSAVGISSILSVTYETTDQEILDYINNQPEEDQKILTCIENYQRVVNILTSHFIYPKFKLVVDGFNKFLDNKDKRDNFIEIIKNSFTAILSYTSTVTTERQISEEEDYFKDLPYYRLDWTDNLEMIYSSGDLISRFISIKFRIGEVLDYNEIKKRIETVYRELGSKIKTKVNASDVKDWFEVENTTVTNSAGKKKRAYKIVSLK